MISQDIGTKPFQAKANCQSGEASNSIPQGSPVCLVLNGTGDGFNVCLPNTGAAVLAHTLFFGVVDRIMAPNDYGIATLFGWVNKGIFAQQTRPTSTDSYASAIAVSLGDKLTIDTVNNCFAGNAAGAASAYLAYAVAAQTLASTVSTASTSSDTSVAKTYALKMFIRAM